MTSKPFCKYILVLTVVMLSAACGDSEPPQQQQTAVSQQPAPAPAPQPAPVSEPPPDISATDTAPAEDTTMQDSTEMVADTMAAPMDNGVVYQDEIYKDWPYTEAPAETTESPVTEMIEEKTEAAKAMVEEKVAEMKQEAEALVAPVVPPVADTSMDNSPAESASEEVTTSAEPIDGRNIYNTYCAICHKGGMNAAPKYGSKALWAKRIAQGRETVYKHAINGLRGMPPRGGFSNLSDEEVKAGTDYMVRGSGGWGDK